MFSASSARHSFPLPSTEELASREIYSFDGHKSFVCLRITRNLMFTADFECQHMASQGKRNGEMEIELFIFSRNFAFHRRPAKEKRSRYCFIIHARFLGFSIYFLFFLTKTFLTAFASFSSCGDFSRRFPRVDSKIYLFRICLAFGNLAYITFGMRLV